MNTTQHLYSASVFARALNVTASAIRQRLKDVPGTQYKVRGQSATFAKDRKRLLVWVVFYPARWLNAKALVVGYFDFHLQKMQNSC